MGITRRTGKNRFTGRKFYIIIPQISKDQQLFGKEITMKKSGGLVFCVTVALAMLFIVSGCARNRETVKAPTPTPAVVKKTPPETTVPRKHEVVVEEIQPIQPKKVEDIFFEFDRFDLSPDARATLADNAAWLENHPGVKMVIEGHCDERGSNEYNLALGDRRAKSALNYLVNLGVNPERLSTISYGEEKPQCTEHNEACWSKNRRDHFTMK